MESDYGIIILDAGASSRLGAPKQLLQYDGKTLIRRTAEIALSLHTANVIVVTGANSSLVVGEIEDLPLTIAVNENWQSGMGSSIKTGTRKLLEVAPEIRAVLVLLCDQPLVTPETVQRLMRQYEKTAQWIIAAQYQNTTGVPALFARELCDELLSLTAEAGAKSLIKKYAASKLAVIDAPEAAFDIDTRQDYARLTAKRQKDSA